MAKKTVVTGREEGDIYVTSWGQTYTAPKVDADKINKLGDNVYLAGTLQKQQRMIFGQRYKLEIHDPKGEQDEDLSKEILAMLEAPDVRAWYNMQIAWHDTAQWGPSLFNPVWGYEGSEYRLQKLRHLPPVSFSTAGQTNSRVKNPVLPGILLNAEGQVEYWQRQSNGIVKQLQNVWMITDPLAGTALGGSPLILPVIPVVSMLDFAWQARMQQVNKIGAGGMFFITVKDAHGDDKAYAQKILRNIGRGVAYQLRENMTVTPIPMAENATAGDAIDALDRLLAGHFSPARDISKNGTLIGGSSGPEYELYLKYIQAATEWVSEVFEVLPQTYLDANAYTGYRAKIIIPAPQIDRSELWLKIADAGFKDEALLVNERRAALAKAGAEIGPLDEEGLAALKAETAGRAAPPMSTFQKAEIAAKILPRDQLDPHATVSKDQAKRISHFIQTTLGIEDGEAG